MDTFLPGYLPTPGFLGTLKPTFGFTPLEVRVILDNWLLENGWLTTFPRFQPTIY